VEKTFVGERVRWRGRLSLVMRHADYAVIWIRLGDGSCVSVKCRMSLEACAALKAVPEEAEIEVEGTIKEVTSYDATLEDCVVMR
jgi:hypothetical protein